MNDVTATSEPIGQLRNATSGWCRVVYVGYAVYFAVTTTTKFKMDKKLQVFVSSTYTDLLSERQTCVEAILEAGHIPAGMELFAAGNETQLQTIKRWIDDCDIYMLILGGRYGSIEPRSKLSYTEIEFRYALSQNKPLFAVVMSDSLLNSKLHQMGNAVIDRNSKFVKFKKLVMSNTIEEFSNNDKLKLAVYKALRDIQSRYNLRGWVRSDLVDDSKTLIKQIENLTRENSQLKGEVKSLTRRSSGISKSKRSLKQFEFDGNTYIVDHWRDMLTKVLFLMAEQKRLQDPTSLFALNGPKTPFFTYDETKLSRPYKIPLSNLYVETHHSPDSFKRLTKAVVVAAGFPDNSFKIVGELPRNL